VQIADDEACVKKTSSGQGSIPKSWPHHLACEREIGRASDVEL
jgi:hypothetical protein